MAISPRCGMWKICRKRHSSKAHRTALYGFCSGGTRAHAKPPGTDRKVEGMDLFSLDGKGSICRIFT